MLFSSEHLDIKLCFLSNDLPQIFSLCNQVWPGLYSFDSECRNQPQRTGLSSFPLRRSSPFSCGIRPSLPDLSEALVLTSFSAPPPPPPPHPQPQQDLNPFQSVDLFTQTFYGFLSVFYRQSSLPWTCSLHIFMLPRANQNRQDHRDFLLR